MRSSLSWGRQDVGIVEVPLPWPAMSLLPPPEGLAAGAAVRFPDGALSRAELEAAAAELRTRLPRHGPLALWASARTATAVGLLAALRAGIAGRPDRHEIRPSRARAHRRGVPAERPARRDGNRARRPADDLPGAGHSSGGRLPTGGPLGRWRPDRLHQWHDWSVKGRRPVRPRDRRQPRRPCATPGSGRPTTCSCTPCRCFTSTGWWSRRWGRCAAAARSAISAPSTPRRSAGALASRRDDAVRGADDVPPARRRGSRRPARSPRACAARDCSYPAPRRCAAAEHARIEELCGQRIVERYGMTETLMIASVRATGERRAGYVGRPLDGRRAACPAARTASSCPATMPRSATCSCAATSLFDGYLGQARETAEALRDGWFATGDLGRVGRRRVPAAGRAARTDLIKSGGLPHRRR